MESFECLLLASVWFKVLSAIDIRNLILQARNATIDIEADNLESLMVELKSLRNKWTDILSECKIVGKNIGMDTTHFFPEKRQRKRKRLHDEIPSRSTQLQVEPPSTAEVNFKRNVFYPLLDCVISNLTQRFNAIKELYATFGITWEYLNVDINELEKKAKALYEMYDVDISGEIVDELRNLKSIHTANLGKDPLQPLELLNALHKYKLDALFPNVCVALRIFCTLPVTIAQAERSFSVLARVKNVFRSLETLAVEAELAREIDFKGVIELFANLKARKVNL